MRNLLHLEIVMAYGLALGSNLVEASRLEQHAAVGPGHPSDGEEANHRGGDKDISVMQRNWDLAQIAVFLAGYKNDVVALAQYTHSQRGIGLVLSNSFAQE